MLGKDQPGASPTPGCRCSPDAGRQRGSRMSNSRSKHTRLDMSAHISSICTPLTHAVSENTASLAKHTNMGGKCTLCAPGERAAHPVSAGRCPWFGCQISHPDITQPRRQDFPEQFTRARSLPRCPAVNQGPPAFPGVPSRISLLIFCHLLSARCWKRCRRLPTSRNSDLANVISFCRLVRL